MSYTRATAERSTAKRGQRLGWRLGSQCTGLGFCHIVGCCHRSGRQRCPGSPCQRRGNPDWPALPVCHGGYPVLRDTCQSRVYPESWPCCWLWCQTIWGVERWVQSFKNAPTDNCQHLRDPYWTMKVCGAFFWEGKADETEVIPHETLVTTSRKVWISVAQRERHYEHPYKSLKFLSSTADPLFCLFQTRNIKKKAIRKLNLASLSHMLIFCLSCSVTAVTVHNMGGAVFKVWG